MPHTLNRHRAQCMHHTESKQEMSVIRRPVLLENSTFLVKDSAKNTFKKSLREASRSIDKDSGNFRIRQMQRKILGRKPLLRRFVALLRPRRCEKSRPACRICGNLYYLCCADGAALHRMRNLGVPGFDSRQSLIVSTPSAVWRLVNPDARQLNGNNSYALAA